MSTETLERPVESEVRDTRETYHLVLEGLVAICGMKVRGLAPRRGDQLCAMCLEVASTRTRRR